MYYVIVAIGVFLTALAFLVTEKNAKFLLSGYNTMSAEERKNVDIRSLIRYFKRFFISLGLSFLLISFGLVYFGYQKMTTVFICSYPVVACFYFVISGQKFYKQTIN